MSAGGLGGEVGEVERRRLEFERLGAGDDEALGAHGLDLVGIVGEDGERRGDAEQVVDMGNVLVVAVVLFEADGGVSLKSGQLVERSLHEHAVAGLADVADASAFLQKIEEDAGAFFGDDLERAFKLLHAIAIAAAQRLAGDAGGVQAGVKGLGADHVAMGERDDVVLVDQILENIGAKESVAGVERAGGQIKRGAVNRTLIEGTRGNHAAGRVLQFGDEFGEIRIVAGGGGCGGGHGKNGSLGSEEANLRQ